MLGHQGSFGILVYYLSPQTTSKRSREQTVMEEFLPPHTPEYSSEDSGDTDYSDDSEESVIFVPSEPVQVYKPRRRTIRGVSRKLARLSSSEDEETISIHSSVEKEEISTKQISTHLPQQKTTTDRVQIKRTTNKVLQLNIRKVQQQTCIPPYRDAEVNPPAESKKRLALTVETADDVVLKIRTPPTISLLEDESEDDLILQPPAGFSASRSNTATMKHVITPSTVVPHGDKIPPPDPASAARTDGKIIASLPSSPVPHGDDTPPPDPADHATPASLKSTTTTPGSSPTPMPTDHAIRANLIDAAGEEIQEIPPEMEQSQGMTRKSQVLKVDQVYTSSEAGDETSGDEVGERPRRKLALTEQETLTAGLLGQTCLPQLD